MNMAEMDEATMRKVASASRRTQTIAQNCPLIVGEAETTEGESIRLILKYDSINKLFLPVVEKLSGKDAMGKSNWEVTTEQDHLEEFLAITTVFSMYAHVVPDQANDLIMKGNTLVEYIADMIGGEEGVPPEIKNPKTRGQLSLLLQQYREKYKTLQAFVSKQLVQ